MKVIFEGKMCDVLEKHDDRDMNGILFNIYTIKKGRKNIAVKVDAFNGNITETTIQGREMKNFTTDTRESKLEFKKMALEKFGATIDINDIELDTNYPFTLKGFVRNKVTKRIVKIVQ